MRQTVQKYIFLALVLATAENANAMTASPQNLEIEQCISRSANTMAGLRGVVHQEAEGCPTCLETTTITLKQKGNEAIHWLSTEDGTF